MRINHNIPAIRSYNQLNKTNKALDQALERLSSGLRINRAADDAAGMAISQKMDAQITGLQQAARNALDGVSLIQTAEGALSEVQEMLKRMRQLAVQSANGTYTPEDRDMAQQEISSLLEEVNRISTDIEFNEKKLLNGEIDRKAFSDSSDFAVQSVSDTVQAGTYRLTVTTNATKATTPKPGVMANSGTGVDEIGVGGIITVNGEDVEISPKDSASTVFDKIRGIAKRVDAEVVSYNSAGSPTPFALNGSTYLVINANQYGSDYGLTINSSSATLLNRLGLGSVAGKQLIGSDVIATIDTSSDFSTNATVKMKGNVITVSDVNGYELKMETLYNTPTGTPKTVQVLDAGFLRLQIGSNEGQTMTIGIPNMNIKALGVENINVSSAIGAQRAVDALDGAISMVSKVRSKLGAYQNRLEYSVSNLNVAAENLTESLSRIEDVDMALEMSTYTQKNVLVQAGTAMLSQANQRPQSVLQLLQN